MVELLLTLAIPRADVKQPAKELLARFGNLRGVLDAPLPELRAVDGIGEVPAVRLHWSALPRRSTCSKGPPWARQGWSLEQRIRCRLNDKRDVWEDAVR